MLIKIKRQDCLDKYPEFPRREYNSAQNEEKLHYPKVFESYILTLYAKSLSAHSKLLSKELSALTKGLQAEKLIFLGDNKNYWLTKLALKRNDSKSLKTAIQYLLDNNIGKRFNGGLEINSLELPIFIKHFSCLVRYDASLPYFHFMDTGKNFIGSICQYGNVHIETLDNKTDRLFNEILLMTKFKIVNDQNCLPSF